MFVVTGATGRTGNAVANYLLDKGENTRVISRNIEKLQPLIDKGAEGFVSEPDDYKKLATAFSEAEVAYIMLQPNYIVTSNDFRAYQNRVTDAIVKAIEKSGIKNIVVLSSW